MASRSTQNPKSLPNGASRATSGLDCERRRMLSRLVTTVAAPRFAAPGIAAPRIAAPRFARLNLLTQQGRTIRLGLRLRGLQLLTPLLHRVQLVVLKSSRFLEVALALRFSDGMT